jgi:hypothetical protein
MTESMKSWANTQRIMCIVITSPDRHENQAKLVSHTWGTGYVRCLAVQHADMHVCLC